MKRLFAVLAVALIGFVALRAPSMAQDEKEEKAEKTEKPKGAAALAAIGGLAAGESYFSFVLVGVTADAFEKGSYDAKKAKTIAGEVANILKTNVAQLEKAKKEGDLAENDAKAIGDFVVLMGEVRDYATKLIDYTEEKSVENGEAFQTARKKCWKHLKSTLGIKGD